MIICVSGVPPLVPISKGAVGPCNRLGTVRRGSQRVTPFLSIFPHIIGRKYHASVHNISLHIWSSSSLTPDNHLGVSTKWDLVKGYYTRIYIIQASGPDSSSKPEASLMSFVMRRTINGPHYRTMLRVRLHPPVTLNQTQTVAAGTASLLQDLSSSRYPTV